MSQCRQEFTHVQLFYAKGENPAVFCLWAAQLHLIPPVHTMRPQAVLCRVSLHPAQSVSVYSSFFSSMFMGPSFHEHLLVAKSASGLREKMIWTLPTPRGNLLCPAACSSSSSTPSDVMFLPRYACPLGFVQGILS